MMWLDPVVTYSTQQFSLLQQSVPRHQRRKILYFIHLLMVVQIYNGTLLSCKKERNSVICSNMDGPRDDHTKRGKSDREIQIPYDITYM